MVEFRLNARKNWRKYKQSLFLVCSLFVAVNQCQMMQTAVGAVGCRDGASRCGLYTAASYMVDKMQHDNEVDVLLSCRYIISGRPTAITSLVSTAVGLQASTTRFILL